MCVMRHRPAAWWLTYAAVLLFASTCTDGPKSSASSTPSPSVGYGGLAVRMIAVPSPILAECRSAPDLREACPSLVPAVEGGQFHSKLMRLGGFDAFQIARSAPYPHLRRKNSPPRFLHLFILGGRLAHAFPFAFDREGDVPAGTSALVQANQDGPVSWGWVTWHSHPGVLVLAPDYELGGINGGHLVFRWRDTAGDHAISLHAWLPIQEAIATLRVIVESIPS